MLKLLGLVLETILKEKYKMRKALLIVLALALVTSVFVSCDNGPKTVTVTFYPGSGEGAAYTQTVGYGVATQLEANKFTNEGYEFVCWSKSPTGGHDFNDQDMVTLTKDLELYAMWTQLYTITVTEVTGGKVKADEASYVISENMQVVGLDITPDEGYYLGGVRLTGSDNTEAVYLFHSILIPMDSVGDILITPVFKEIPPTVDYLNASWDGSKVETTSETVSSYYLVTKNLKEWTDGKWYVVADDVIIKDRITVTGTVNLILTDVGTLKAEKGITVASGATLNIYGQTFSIGLLQIAGVESGNAGIGGTAKADCGNIVIKGGVVQVNGGESGAGIGAGKEHSAGSVTLYRGGIIATGGNSGAGIGGGEKSENGGTITFYGGIVKAQGGTYSAGIGGGEEGNGGTINLLGGKVTSIGCTKTGYGGAGIGGGKDGNGGTITLGGAHVEANGGDFSAGIGGGWGGSGGTVKISGGSVTAKGSRGAAGIGGAENGDGADVTISGGNINVEGGVGEMQPGETVHTGAIGKGYHHSSTEGDDKSLTLEGGVKLQTQDYKDGAPWKDWDGTSRPYRMKTKE